MISLRTEAWDVVVDVSGRDALLFATRWHWSWRVPLAHVRWAEVREPVVGSWRRRYLRTANGELRCARKGLPALHVRLDEEPFHLLALTVPDPEAAVGRLRALGVGR